MCSSDIFLGLLAILFPPLPVWVKRGICSVDSLINILLCLVGFIPGLIHAWYIIAKFPEPGYDYDRLQQDEEARVYVFVHDGRPQPPRNQQQQGQQLPKTNKKPGQPHGNMSYGTTGAPSAPAPQTDGGEGSSEGHPPPPSYAQVVAGDNKVQTQE